jgi:hypothetical protein
MSLSVSSARIGETVGGVVAQALSDANADGLLILESASPEGRLLVDWASATIGAERIHTSPADTSFSVDALAGLPLGADNELRRAFARLDSANRNWLLAHPANKTALLLSRDPPPERLLPLGDLYASQVRELAGACTLPPEVDAVISAAGGLDAVDAALFAWLEQRLDLESALARLGTEAANLMRSQLRRNRAVRRWPRIVPKLGSRTLWVDLCA